MCFFVKGDWFACQIFDLPHAKLHHFYIWHNYKLHCVQYAFSYANWLCTCIFFIPGVYHVYCGVASSLMPGCNLNNKPRRRVSLGKTLKLNHFCCDRHGKMRWYGTFAYFAIFNHIIYHRKPYHFQTVTAIFVFTWSAIQHYHNAGTGALTHNTFHNISFSPIRWISLLK